MVDGSRVNVACRYVAAVPELSAGLPRIPGLPWALLSHRHVLAELATAGWVPCGVGDWAVALRSPQGTLAARVCPFDPAYRAFVDLCRECAGNRWLPRIELAAGLEGGGSVVVLEFVAPVDHPVHGQFAEQWRARAGDAAFQQVRRAAQMIDAEYRESTPWWGRCGLDDAHIFRAADGPVLIDVFCMAGTELYRAILEDVAEVHRRFRASGCATHWKSRISPGRTAPPRSSPLERPGHALPDDRSRVCQGTAADAPSRSRTPDLPPQSAHILAAETCALGGSARVGQEQDLSQTVTSSLGAHAAGCRL